MNEFIEQDICELLLDGATEKSALVRQLLLAGYPDGDPRLYWGVAPQDVPGPWAILGSVASDSDSTNDGASGFEQDQYTITCWDRSGMEPAARVAKAIRRRLKELCAETAADRDFNHKGRAIQGIFYAGQVDVTETPDDGGQIGTVGRVVRLSIAYEDNETA